MIALYRLLLAFAPAEFRREYAGEMLRDLQESLEEARELGAFATFSTLLRAYWDLLGAAFAEHAVSIERDVSYAWRMFVKSPLSTAIVVLTLGIGIAANTSVFAILNAVLLHPMAYPEPGRIVTVVQNQSSNSIPDALDWAQRNRSFSALAAFNRIAAVETRRGVPKRLAEAQVTGQYFNVLGAQPLLGRLLNARDMRPGSANAVISESVWRSQFQASPSALGASIVLDDRQYRIVGVMPDLPADLFTRGRSDVWVAPHTADAFDRDLADFSTIARLKPGVSLNAARADMNRIAESMARDFPENDKAAKIVVLTYQEAFAGDDAVVLLMVGIAMAGVLLVCCANAANLLLSRAASRTREVAVRLAVGSSRARVIAQLFVESALYAIFAGVVALCATALITGRFSSLISQSFPYEVRVHLDGWVFAFCFAAAATAALGCGIAPATVLSRTNLVAVLKNGTHGSAAVATARLRNAFVVTQIALALTLVVASTLVVRSLIGLVHADTGLRYDGIAVSESQQFPNALKTQAQRTAYVQNLLAALHAVPELRQAELATEAPLTGEGSYVTPFAVSMHRGAGKQIGAHFNLVTPYALQLLGVHLVRGRFFAGTDAAAHERVALVSERFAREAFPGSDALGKLVYSSISQFAPYRMRQTPVRIVGIVSDFKTDDPAAAAPLQFFEPLLQDPAVSSVHVIVKSPVPAAQLAKTVTRAWRTVDPEIPDVVLTPYPDEVSSLFAQWRIASIVLGSLAAIALLLALAGVYGVMAYSVAQRTQELGIRIALGAKRSEIVMLVLRRTIVLVGIGVAVGTVAAAAVSRLLQNMLFAVSANDPSTFVGVATAIVAFGLSAGLVPAMRATQVEPANALRYE